MDTQLTLADDETSKQINVYITYTDENGTKTNGQSKITVSKAITPVTDIEFSGRPYLDVYDHKSANINASVQPAAATDRTVTYSLVDDTKLNGDPVANKASDYITINDEGVVTVKEGVTLSSTSTTVTVRVTTNGVDLDGNTISKDKDVYIRKHQINNYTIAEKNGDIIGEAVDSGSFAAFEYGKTYVITAYDTYFPDDQDCTWDVNNGKSFLEIKETNGTQCTVYCKGVSGDTDIKISAKIHDSSTNNITKKSVYQDVSDITITADKTELYTNETATITLAVNEFATVGEVTWNISDTNIASVAKVDDTHYTVSFAKQGEVTISANINGVDSNEIEFDVVQHLNELIEESVITSKWTVSTTNIAGINGKTSLDVTDDHNNTLTISRNEVKYSGNSSGYMQLGKSSNPESVTISCDLGDKQISAVRVQSASKDGAHKVAISVGGTSYLSAENTSSWSTMKVNEGTGTSSGEIEITFTNGSAALYIGYVEIVYVSRENISDSDFEGQKALVNWATKFMDNTDNGFGVGANCADGVGLSHSWEEMESAWDAAKSAYNTTFGSLTSDDTVYKMFKAAEASTTGDILQQAMARYEAIAQHYGLKGEDLFISQRPKPESSRINPILALNNVDNSVWVISAVALVGLTAIGGYFFYRKRKEI